MKKTRVILLVMIMMCVSALSFVSQGEQFVSKKAYLQSGSYYRMSHEITSIKKDINERVLSRSKKAFIEPDQAILNQEFGVMQYSSIKKNTIYTSEREIIYNENLDERVQIILELTPLDAETAKIVLEYADDYNVRPSLILGVMDLESNFSQYLVGTSQDRGYMQIIPGTEKWLATKHGEELGLSYNPERIFEADYNIPLAVKYLSILLEQYNNNDTKALTSYNRGDGGLKKWYEIHGTYETAYSRVVLKREKKYLLVK